MARTKHSVTMSVGGGRRVNVGGKNVGGKSVGGQRQKMGGKQVDVSKARMSAVAG